jgi:hypothetical protein
MRRGAGAAFVFLLAVVLTPVWTTDVLPLQDYPNHIARLHILTRLDHEPALQEYYRANWRLFPNLGFDLLAFYPTRVLGADVAGRLFITLTFVLLVSGTAALNYVLHRSVTAWSLSGFLFLYSGIFLLGFLSYLLGVALFLWLTALWIAWRDRGELARLVLFTLLTTVLLVCHLFAFGLYALTIAGYELGAYLRTRRHDALGALRRLGLAALQFVVPASLFFVLSPTSTVVAQATSADRWAKLFGWLHVVDLYSLRLQLAVVGVFFVATLG